MIGFSAIYAALLAAYIVFIVRTVKTGPERDHPDVTPDPTPQGSILAELLGTEQPADAAAEPVEEVAR
jgi:cytochrome bd-type quinol oxidase subunit 1